MRPSFHCAAGWPCSAAYCSAVSALAFSSSSGWLVLRKPSFGVSAAVFGVDVPSNAKAGEIESPSTGPRAVPKPSPAAMQSALASATPLPLVKRAALGIRITRLLGTAARMGHRAIARRSDLLGVFPQIAGRVFLGARLPGFGAGGKLGVAELDVQRALFGIELDDVAVANEPDRAAHGGLRPDMADAKTARRTGEAAVGDQRDLAAHALTVERSGGRQHFTHAGAAFRALITDDQHVAFPVGPVLDRLEASFLAIEAARRPAETQARHAGNLNDGAVGREIALKAHNTTGRRQRFVGRVNHVLVRIPLHRLHILRNRAAGDGEAVAMEEAVIEQRPHQKRNTTSLEHIFGDITAGRFQIRDIRGFFENFGNVEKV